MTNARKLSMVTSIPGRLQLDQCKQPAWRMLTPELLVQRDVDELTNAHHFDIRLHQSVMTRLSCG